MRQKGDEMQNIIKSDYVFAIILIGTWLFYLMFEGPTRFDVNQTITLPLLVAVDFTAITILYVAGRYFTAKKSNLIKKGMNSLMGDHQDEQAQDKTESENTKS